MKSYDDEYFIVTYDNTSHQMHVNIHEKSENVVYDGQKLIISTPLFFEPSFQERHKRLGVTPQKTNVMFDGSSFIINNAIRQDMIKYDFKGMQLYPAILIETDGHWDETYWYLNIWQDLDCWDKKKSIVKPLKQGRDISDTKVKKYYLDEDILNATPEQDRLIFRMGGEFYGYIFMHKKLVDIFVNNNHTGIRFFKVSTFEAGMQF